ncbi:hypothetical protein SDC9_111983 [bioreactor metagenome]|uniref:Dienelactone hydrolase domain-containing protein n=1 Tax=bioreactor metagenome TaxID=1076179 RepID=A0A645BKN4_9ZZZZ
MIQKISNQQKAVILLHEIYGINQFMEDTCNEYHRQGFDVFCPDMLAGEFFSYSEAAKAHQYFSNKIGFDFYREMEPMIEQLKHTYDKIFLIGFSAGATVAWRCSENNRCDGIVCCYGSRIRDYLPVQPKCPVLLLFAEQDLFDVEGVINQLSGKNQIEIRKVQASHGFMDPYSPNYNRKQAIISKKHISDFFKRI